MNRFFEIIPGGLAWITIILIFLLSWLTPAAVAIFIILFDIYWLFKTIYLSFHLRATFKKMRENLKIDWLLELANLHKYPTNNTNKDIREISDQIRDYSRIYHLVILPMYKEPYEVVRESFAALASANYPKEKIIAVLATEERAGDGAGQARPLREAAGGSGSWPHEAPDDSNMTAAISSRSSITFTTAAVSLLGMTIESELTSCGTPGVVPPS